MRTRENLERLEAAVTRALEAGDASELEIVGYGEITLVLRCRVDGRSMACKRLPGLANEAAFSVYRRSVEDYVARLGERGIVVPETTVHAVEGSDGRLTAYCLQPELPAETLLVDRLRNAEGPDAAPFFEEIVARVAGCVNDRMGLDAQLSNWAWTEDGMCYYDISTPFLRDEHGGDVFDVELHVASVPWALRWAVRLFAIDTILDKFYTVRGALLDLAGNLYKERMGAVVPTLLRLAEPAVERPITEHDAAAYYRGDARLWALLQRLRRADRWWQRTVRRRTYPFLLPGKIDR